MGKLLPYSSNRNLPVRKRSPKTLHLDLLEPAAIRLLIFENRVEIINAGCLYGGLEVKDILLGVTKQRNPTIASLSSRTMIYRGLGSGILRAIRENVKVEFVNNESSNEFKTIVWRPIPDDHVNDGVNSKYDGVNTDTEGVNDDVNKKALSPLGKQIIDLLASNPTMKQELMAEVIGVSKSTIERQIRNLRQLGILVREGSDKSGFWRITKC